MSLDRFVVRRAALSKSWFDTSDLIRSHCSGPPASSYGRKLTSLNVCLPAGADAVRGRQILLTDQASDLLVVDRGNDGSAGLVVRAVRRLHRRRMSAFDGDANDGLRREDRASLLLDDAGEGHRQMNRPALG